MLSRWLGMDVGDLEPMVGLLVWGCACERLKVC